MQAGKGSGMGGFDPADSDPHFDGSEPNARRNGSFGMTAMFDTVHAFLDDALELVRKEVELAKAEFEEKLTQIQYGLIFVFAGLMCCAVAAFLLAQALVAWIAIYLGEAGAALLVGGIILAIGIVALLSGFSNLKAKNLKPVRTIRSNKENATRLKETFDDKIK